MTSPPWLAKLQTLPTGYSVGVFRGRSYGLTRTLFAGGRSEKFYAEELGGADFVSLNVYHTGAGVRLKPCEMPVAKVTTFLREVSLIDR